MEDYIMSVSEDFHLDHSHKWDAVKKLVMKIEEEAGDQEKFDPGVRLLPRSDVTLYGIIPKLEKQILYRCKVCKIVFNPRDILSHKNCLAPPHIAQQPLSKKKVISKGKKKKTQSRVTPSPPPLSKKAQTPPIASTSILTSNTLPELKVSVSKVILPKIPKSSSVSSCITSSTASSSKPEIRVTSTLSKVTSVHSPRSNSTNSHISKSPAKSPLVTPMDTLPVPSPLSTDGSSTSTAGTSAACSSGSNRYNKKSKRSSNISISNKVVTKDYDPDVHCGVTEGNRGPCTRSITCSNHRIQLRKLVPGRSKDIHQLIAERKAAKEKDLKATSSSCSYTSPNGEEKEMFCQNTSYVPIVAKIVTTVESPSTVTTSFVPIMPKVSSNPRQITTSTISSKKLNVIVSETESSRKLTNGYISEPNNFETASQDGVGTVPIVYMPMSPISVVSPVQFVKIGNNMICLESPQSAMSPPIQNKSVFLPLSSNTSNSNMKLYKSHPKPMVLPTFGARNVGGAILLANPRIESQRKELLTAIETYHETVNNHRVVSLPNHSTPHRPNILKVKSSARANNKRPANDKLVTSDNKRLVPDVNGFILHADVSELADAPKSSNCIQEKIALLNMK
ncbi:ataxin-7-like protein 1 [Cylas formicarius]|uniref:ataxin-7-like protein 1 n=1 Tax=Cylas formicarius TaxID=197179 RepID=UPI00295893C9|nr:ataxin-7-like protein 1 [Cylas formicarius]XP_060537302.1 ataxin-7-like protein 1 [Cylas formicarius]XP_060537303.1 ataxin-7-like protein 1 [Cylas formicarius]